MSPARCLPRTVRRRTGYAAGGLVAVMVLSACGAESDPTSVEEPTATHENSDDTGGADGTDGTTEAAQLAPRGTVAVGDRSFTFDPRTCWVRPDDSEINGPGREEGGDVVHVDLSGDGPGEGAVRIDLGTDQPFESSERTITADRYVSEPLAFTIDGLSVTASGLFLDEHGGAALDEGVKSGVADQLEEDGLGVLVDRPPERRRIGAVDVARRDADLRQRVGEEVVRPAVQRR